MISEALRLLRVFHDLKQKELAEKLGVSNSYVSEIENGNRTPSLDVIERYAETFRIPVSSIMFFAENIGATQPSGRSASIGRTAIASKILDFLRLIEAKTDVTDAA
ncbi:helix-turn-helix transcriptional regulator [Maricaulis sp.]|uniref:helix-turn-helix transcriptional regulator n=1 Tax=Maricaulis sp. TaxID=1486257 RepID=UPI003A8E8480